MKRRNKVVGITYFACSMLWVANAGINVLRSNISMSAVYLALSVTFFCLGITYRCGAKDDSGNSLD